MQIHERRRPLDLSRVEVLRLQPLGEVRANEFALRFVTGPVPDYHLPGWARDY